MNEALTALALHDAIAEFGWDVAEEAAPKAVRRLRALYPTKAHAELFIDVSFVDAALEVKVESLLRELAATAKPVEARRITKELEQARALRAENRGRLSVKNEIVAFAPRQVDLQADLWAGPPTEGASEPQPSPGGA